MKGRHVVVALLPWGSWPSSSRPWRRRNSEVRYSGPSPTPRAASSPGEGDGHERGERHGRRGQTNADGRYVVPFLVPATYTVEVSAEASRPSARRGPRPDPGQDQPPVQAGGRAQAETVEVVAHTPLLQQDNATSARS